MLEYFFWYSCSVLCHAPARFLTIWSFAFSNFESLNSDLQIGE